MENSHFQFPELFQFFGGYFYQGWAADYSWEGRQPNFEAVVRHFRALNPPSTVNRVISEIEQLLALNLEEHDFDDILSALGNNYYLKNTKTDYRSWLETILVILRESTTNSKILREIN